jgi:hypothetical protein
MFRTFQQVSPVKDQPPTPQVAQSCYLEQAEQVLSRKNEQTLSQIKKDMEMLHLTPAEIVRQQA